MRRKVDGEHQPQTAGRALSSTNQLRAPDESNQRSTNAAKPRAQSDPGGGSKHQPQPGMKPQNGPSQPRAPTTPTEGSDDAAKPRARNEAGGRRRASATGRGRSPRAGAANRAPGRNQRRERRSGEAARVGRRGKPTAAASRRGCGDGAPARGFQRITRAERRKAPRDAPMRRSREPGSKGEGGSEHRPQASGEAADVERSGRSTASNSHRTGATPPSVRSQPAHPERSQRRKRRSGEAASAGRRGRGKPTAVASRRGVRGRSPRPGIPGGRPPGRNDEEHPGKRQRRDQGAPSSEWA